MHEEAIPQFGQIWPGPDFFCVTDVLAVSQGEAADAVLRDVGCPQSNLSFELLDMEWVML